MGTFLGQALKSGRGDPEWRSFFALCGSAVAHLEKSAPVPGFENLTELETFQEVARRERQLRVLEKLRGFAIAAERIVTEKGPGNFQLVVLNSANRSVSIRSFGRSRLEEANAAYAEVEELQQAGEQIEAVLVSVGPVEALKKAYPNFFLDTNDFIAQVEDFIRRAK